MVMVEQRTTVTPVLGRTDEVDPGPWTDDDDAAERRLRTMAVTGAVVFLAVLAGFWAWWPAGVALGLVAGTLAVLQVGRVMQEHAFADSADALSDLAGEEELREEFARLRSSLGDDWPTFRRAAVLVTRAQWASVAGLQRELHVSTATAQHIMGRLEREGFVGPSRGGRPRVVRLARERAAELEALMRS